jgi:2-dehydro-3-deoxy-D-arabinonate dehydratase
VRLVRYQLGDREQPEVGAEFGDGIRKLAVASIGDLLRRPLAEIRALAEAAGTAPSAGPGALLLPPADGRTEIWAAGVTYSRSRQARMEESATADIYDLVYDSERPELFFKCAAWRAVTGGEPIGIRRDSDLNVPEPELAVVVNSRAEIVGYAVCNDVSSRSIEGENPLYLPQAKVYAGSCALSDGIRPAWEVPAADALDVELIVERAGQVAWQGSTNTSQLRRPPWVLAEYLFREEQFPDGAIISTGTGIVPGMDFTLREGDQVTVRVDQVGVLVNPVAVGRERFGWLLGSAADRRAARRLPNAAP